MTPNISDLRIEVADLKRQIEAVEKKEANSYSSQVAKVFPLGMVGGSGRNVKRYNKRRESEIDKSVENAKRMFLLYSEYQSKSQLLAKIESGEYQKEEEQKANKEANRINTLIAYWKSLKAGDKVTLFTGNEVIISRKNKKSITTTGGSKFSALEIIGKKAAEAIL